MRRPAPPAQEPVAPELEFQPEPEPEPVETASSEQPAAPLIEEAPAPAPVPEPVAVIEPARVEPIAPPAPTPSETRARERRKAKRDNLVAPALVRVDGYHGPPLKVDLIDISIAGVRLRAPHRLEIGEKAQIRLEVGPFRWTTRLRVVHSTPHDNGAATVGCAFLRTELLRPWPLAAA